MLLPLEDINMQISQKKKLKSNILTNEEQIILLKNQLAETDYKAIKYAEGWITEENYNEIKLARQALRDQINELGG